MRHLLFNAVVLGALAYLFAAEGRLDLPLLSQNPMPPQPVAEAPLIAPVAEPADEPVVGAAAPAVAEPPALIEPVADKPAVVEENPEVRTASVEEPVFTSPSAEVPAPATPVEETGANVAPALPELGEPETVAALPETVVPPATSEQPVQIAEGEALMSVAERCRELDRLIENMELFYIERIAR